jgi:adenosine deaminase
MELNPIVDSRRLAAHRELGALLRRMPKAELHLHLDGCLRPATALALARERGLGEDLDLAGMRERLAGPAHATDQAELLRAFDLPIAIMQDAESLRRITAELVEDVASDGTRYAEIRWAPGLHMARGLSLADGIAAVVRGAHDGVSAVSAIISADGGPDGNVEPGTRAASDAPVVVRLIAVAMRSHDPRESLRVAESAAVFAGEWLTGFDVAGPEAAYPDVLAHWSAIEAARSAGLGISIHAGEWGGAAQIRRALELDPARIAHGAPAIDDPALVAELRTRGVTLDLCPTSNVQAGMYARLADHPLPRLLRAGVPVTLSTDERTVTGVTLVDEYHNAVDVLGLTLAELWAIDRHALEVAFLADDEPVRAGLLDAFDAFAADERLVRG